MAAAAARSSAAASSVVTAEVYQRAHPRPLGNDAQRAPAAVGPAAAGAAALAPSAPAAPDAQHQRSAGAASRPQMLLGHFRAPEARVADLLPVGDGTRRASERITTQHLRLKLSLSFTPKDCLRSDRSGASPPLLFRFRFRYRGPGRRCLLQRSAAISFAAMRHAAAQDGVSLVPVSGFRSVGEQEEIYFGLKARMHNLPESPARISRLERSARSPALTSHQSYRSAATDLCGCWSCLAGVRNGRERVRARLAGGPTRLQRAPHGESRLLRALLRTFPSDATQKHPKARTVSPCVVFTDDAVAFCFCDAGLRDRHWRVGEGAAD